MPIEISVIILNYNSSHYTVECIQTILEKTTPKIGYEVFVVDNHSSESDYNQLDVLRKNQHVTLIRNNCNLGFSNGNAKALPYVSSNSRYLFFLNNDCLFLNDVLGELYCFMEQNPTAGICTGQMYSPQMEPQSSFGYFPSLGVAIGGHSILRFFLPRNYPSLHKRQENPQTVPRVSGSAMFIRASFFHEINGFDMAYYLYCEEEDLCLRMARKGYPAYLVPAARFIHIGGASTKRDASLRMEKEYFISLFYFFRKFYPLWKIRLLRTIYFLKNIRKIYKNKNYFSLAFFIARGASPEESLRFHQKVSQQ